MASNLQIFVELKDPQVNLDAVSTKIKELGSWARVSISFWYVDSSYSASAARDYISEVLVPGDKLFVVNASSGQAAWHGLSDKVAAFVRDKWNH